MDKIALIKNTLKIEDVISKYLPLKKSGANLVACCPFHAEKSPSFTVSKNKQIFSCFGCGEGGDLISFVEKIEKCTISEAINKICSTFGIDTEIDYIPDKTNQFQIKEDTRMSPEILEKCFNGAFYTNLNFKKENHLEQLKTISPLWLFSEAKKDDLEFFKSISKFVESRSTTIHKLPDCIGDCYTMKYRYYFDEEQNKMIKWRSLNGTKSSYLYTRLTNRDTILVVEGTRDYLTALLCGFDVVSLYSVNYKFTNDDYLLLKGKKVIFIDDFGANAIKNIHDNFEGEKIYFNHNLMRKISKCESKDFSDYLYHFKSLDDFLKAFNEVTKTSGTWEDGLDFGKTVTLEFLDSKPDVEPLFDKFIYKATTTVIHSAPGQGKTILILSIIKHCIDNKKIKKVIYFDADNPPSVLKDRLTGLLEQYKKEIIYFSSALMTTNQMEMEMDRLCTYKNQGEDILVVVDVLGRFVKGSIKNDSDVVPIIAKINRLAIDFGATSIIVHHSNKEKGDEGRPIFQGSQQIAGNTDATYGLVREINKINLFKDKARFGYVADNVKFEIDAREFKINSFEAKYIGEDDNEDIELDESEDIEITLEDLIQYIKENNSVSLSKIKARFNASKNRPKDKKRANEIWSLIQDNKDIIEWNGEYKNKARYSVINKSPTITEFETTLSDTEIMDIFGD